MSDNNFIELLGVRDQLDEEKLEYLPSLKRGAEAFERVHSIFTSPNFQSKEDGWRKDGGTDEEAAVYSMAIEEGRLFSLHFELAVPLETFVNDDWNEVENISKWNADVETSKRLVELTDNADIVHYASGKMLMVAGRDYVSLRIRRNLDGITYTSCYSVDAMPETSDRVRGFLHVNGGRFQQHPAKPGIIVVDTLICVDMKGNIPKSMINSMMPKMLLKESRKIRERWERLQQDSHSN